MERSSQYPEFVLQAGGIDRVAGKTTADEDTWFSAEGVVGDYRGQFSRMTGKVAQGNLGVPIMGFAQFWSPLGYMVGLQQTGYGTEFPGEVSGEIILVPPGSTSIPQYFGFSGSGGTEAEETFDDDIEGTVTQLTPNQWFADWTGVSPDPSCVNQNLSGTIGPLNGDSPFSNQLNNCDPTAACALPGRGVRIISNDGIETCYLTGAGWISWNPSYRLELATWHIVITGSSGVLLDQVVASSTEPVLNLP